MYVSTLPVKEELIVMEAVRVTKVQYLQKGEVSSDMYGKFMPYIKRS